MKLTKKGQEANIGVKQLKATISWTTAMDFDLAALYEKSDGKHGMVYFGNRDECSLNEFPYIQLDEDAGVGDTAGDNEENLTIAEVADEIDKIYLLAWDYEAMKDGKPARFEDSDVKLTITDDKGETQEVTLDTGDTGNVTNIATIDNSSAVGAKLVNASKIDTLKGFPETSNTFLNVCKQ